MSMHPQQDFTIPEETVRVVQAACQAKVEMSPFLQSRDVPFWGGEMNHHRRRAVEKWARWVCLPTFP